MEKSPQYPSRRLFGKKLTTSLGVCLLLPKLALAKTATPTQTEGPFYPDTPEQEKDTDLTHIEGHTELAEGETILVRGRVLNTDGKPIKNAEVDIWQANHHGRYSHREDPNPAPLDAHFQGWGITKTDELGHYGFKTIKPGAYPLKYLGGPGWRCRHIHFKVSCLGYKPITTQMYFEGDTLIEQDLEIAKVPKDYQHLLIADQQKDQLSGLPLFRFDVMLAKI
ncbi:protocatechuate 3,4-dioxygenase [Aestuariibacter salexigens]|uniref:dioxygenase family protein n=1 Tax=Aestuariibacter salexigens TaxID=226010 RepID=UPI00041C6682|nr:protocatechuate 3,4-dioxygenase [Aestuariibacter salexigens]